MFTCGQNRLSNNTSADLSIYVASYFYIYLCVFPFACLLVHLFSGLLPICLNCPFQLSLATNYLSVYLAF